jgi:hypothetical protein
MIGDKMKVFYKLMENNGNFNGSLMALKSTKAIITKFTFNVPVEIFQ